MLLAQLSWFPGVARRPVLLAAAALGLARDLVALGLDGWLGSPLRALW